MKLSHGLAVLVGVLACLVVGCGDGAPAEPSSPGSSTGEAAPAPAAIAGKTLFEDHCTKCHGDSVSLSSFATAADVFSFVSENMPRDAPGSLSESEYYGIVAFDLSARGVDLHGETLDATNAASISVR